MKSTTILTLLSHFDSKLDMFGSTTELEKTAHPLVSNLELKFTQRLLTRNSGLTKLLNVIDVMMINYHCYIRYHQQIKNNAKFLIFYGGA